MKESVRRAGLRLILAATALKLSGALAVFLLQGATDPAAFKELALPPVFYLILMLAVGAGGTLLLWLGRDDRRAWYLALFFLLLATPFSNRWLLQLAGSSGSGAWVGLFLSSLPVDAFFAYFFWRFTGEFPDADSSVGLRRTLAVGSWTTLLLGFLLFGHQIVLLLRSMLSSVGAWQPSKLALQKPDYDYYVPLAIATVAGLVVLFLRARDATGAERRRVGLFAAGLGLGIAPLFLQMTLVFLFPSYQTFLDHRHLAHLASGVLLSIFFTTPFTTSYSVLVHQVLNVKLIARRALQYALARYSAMTLATVPLASLLIYVYFQRSRRVDDIFSGARLLLIVSTTCLGLATLRYRRRLLEGIDRRFFREQYDSRQILTLLGERIRATHDVAGLASLIAREIDLALHLEGVSLLVLDPRSNLLTDPKIRSRRLDAASPLALMIANASDPLPVDLESGRSALQILPDKDRHWLVDNGFRLVVPILARDGSLLGLIGLGDKKSGLPFLREDRHLLRAIAGSAAWVIELDMTHPPAGRLVRRGVLAADDAEAEVASPAVDVAKECPVCGVLYPSYTILCNSCSRRLEPSHVPYVLPGKFRFERRIGQGGMGVVYRGSDVVLGRPVAVKTMRRVSPEDAMRLRREARTAAAVSHLHLASIYGMETWQGTPMMVLELLEGGTLAHRVEERLSPLATVDLGISMSEALAQLHAADILHRDIKPSNIGYTRDGVPKLMDFGIARILFDLRRDSDPLSPDYLEDHSSTLPPTSLWNRTPDSDTVSNQLVGTLSYLSPEALNGIRADPSFDLWSLSIVLFEFLLGRKVFSGGDVRQLMNRIRQGRVPDFDQVCPEQPPALGEFFRSALHKTLARRPTDARELKERLLLVRRQIA